jgi:hypothetical protein
MIPILLSMALQPFTNQHPLKPFQLSLVNNPISGLAKDNRIINQHPYLFNHEIKTNNGYIQALIDFGYTVTSAYFQIYSEIKQIEENGF